MLGTEVRRVQKYTQGAEAENSCNDEAEENGYLEQGDDTCEVGEKGLNFGKMLMLGMARLADGCVGKISGLSTWEFGMPFNDMGTTRTIMYQASFLAAQELE